MKNDTPQTNPMPHHAPVTAPNQSQGDSSQAPPSLPSAFDLIPLSWQAIRLNITTFLALIIFPVLAFIFYFVMIVKSGGGGAYDLSMSNTSSTTNAGGLLLSLLVFTVVIVIVEPMLLYATTKSAQGQKISLEEAINGGFRFFFRLVGLGIIAFFCIVVGFILLIVPGVFMWKRFLLSPYIMISDNLSLGETLHQTKVISKEYSGAIWGVLGVTFLISLIGIIPFIGTIISGILGVIYYVAPAIRYEQIKKLGTASGPAVPPSEPH